MIIYNLKISWNLNIFKNGKTRPIQEIWKNQFHPDHFNAAFSMIDVKFKISINISDSGNFLYFKLNEWRRHTEFTQPTHSHLNRAVNIISRTDSQRQYTIYQKFPPHPCTGGPCFPTVMWRLQMAALFLYRGGLAALKHVPSRTWVRLTISDLYRCTNRVSTRSTNEQSRQIDVLNFSTCTQLYTTCQKVINVSKADKRKKQMPKSIYQYYGGGRVKTCSTTRN